MAGRPSGPSTRKRKKAKQPTVVKSKKARGAPPLGTGPEYQSGGLKNVLPGIHFQTLLLMLFLKRGVDHKYDFLFGSEAVVAEKFDDVIFRYKKYGKYLLRVLQAKYSEGEGKKITRYELIKYKLTDKKTKHDYSIPKYFTYFLRRKKEMKENFLTGDIQDFILCTNIDIDKSLEDSFDPIDTSSDHLLKFKNFVGPRSLKLKQGSPLYNELYGILLNTIHVQPQTAVAKVLGSMLAKNFYISRNKILLDHREWILQHILDRKTLVRKENKYSLKFKREFLFAEENTEIMETFLNSYLKHKGINEEEAKQELLEQRVQVVPSFIKELLVKKDKEQVEEYNEENNELELEDDIKFFLDKLVFAVGQPIVSELKDIIQKEMAEKTNQADSEPPTSILQTRVEDWLMNKRGKFITNRDGQSLFEDLNYTIALAGYNALTLKSKKEIEKYRTISGKDFIRFKNCGVIKNIKTFLNTEKGKQLLLVYYDCRLLMEFKMMQLKEKSKTGGFIYSNIKDYLSVINTEVCPVQAFKSQVCKHIFIKLTENSELNNDTIGLLNNVITDMKQDKKVIIMMPRELQNEFKNAAQILLDTLKYEEEIDCENKFEDLCEKTQNSIKENSKLVFEGCNVHVRELLEYDEDVLKKLEARDLERLIRGELRLGAAPRDQYQETEKYYVKRSVILHSDKTNTIEVNHVNDINDNLVVITGEPGAGKSSLLAHVADETKKKQLKQEAETNMCIIKANLRDYNTLLFQKEKENIKVTKLEGIAFLYNISGLSPEERTNKIKFQLNDNGELSVEKKHGHDSLGLSLFQYLYNNNKIILLLDSYDEIAPRYAERVNNYIVKFKDMRIQRIWVATRPYGIEDKLIDEEDSKRIIKATPYSLMPLTIKEQKVLLNRFCDQVTGETVEFEKLHTLCKNMQYIGHPRNNEPKISFLSIPQQLIILANLYKKKIANNPDIKNMNRYDIYSKCVEDIFEKTCVKIRKEDPKDGEKIHNTLITTCQRIAMMELWPGRQLPARLVPRTMPDRLRKKVTRGAESNGLLLRRDGEPRFVHRSYAEFFAGRYLADEVSTRATGQSEVKDFLHNIMLNREMSGLTFAFFNYRIIERMVEDQKKRKRISFIEEDADIFKAAIEGDQSILQHQKLMILQDALGRSPLHLMICNCSTKVSIDFFNIKRGFGPFTPDDKRMLITKPDGLFNWTALHYFVLFHIYNNWQVSQLPLNFSLNVQDLEARNNLKDSFGLTPLMLYCKRNVCESDKLSFLLKYIKNTVNAQDETGRTALHHAILSNNQDAVAKLTHCGSDLQKLDNHKQTPLDIIISTQRPDDTRFVKIFLKLKKSNKRRLNEFLSKYIQDEDWRVYLLSIEHTITRAMLEIMDTNGLDVNVRDSKGNTALHRTMQLQEWPSKRTLKNVCLLLMMGGSTLANIKDNSGRAPADYWSEQTVKKIQGLVAKRGMFEKFNNGFELLLNILVNI